MIAFVKTTDNSSGSSIGLSNVLSGSLTVGSTAAVALGVAGGATVGGNLTVSGTLVIPNLTANSGAGTGALQVAGGASVGDSLYVGGTGNFGNGARLMNSQPLYLASNFNGHYLQYNATPNGPSLQGYGGGILGCALGSAAQLAWSQYGTTIAGNCVLSGTTASTGAGTGALQVAGGASIAGSVYVGGNAVFGGGARLNAQPLYLAYDNNHYLQYNATPDGPSLQGYRGGQLGCAMGSTAQLAWTNSGTTIAGTCVLSGTTASTAAGTGALQVAGGASVGGNLYVGAALYVNNILAPTKAYVDNAVATNTVQTLGLGGTNSVALGASNCFGTASTCAGYSNVGVGNGVLTVVAGGGANTAMGTSVLPLLTAGSSNTGVGNNVMPVAATTGNHHNVGVGANILSLLTGGAYNTGVGYNALASVVGAGSNVAMGSGAGQYTLGSNNTLLGSGTGQASGDTNAWSNSTAVGCGAVTTASNQIVLGTTAEAVVCAGTTASTVTGTGALRVAGGASVGGNIYVGGGVYVGNVLLTNGGGSTTNGLNSLGIGASTLTASTGTDNVALGYQTMQNNGSGNSNVAIGRQAMQNNVLGRYNVAIGWCAASSWVGNNVDNGNTLVGGGTLGNATSGNGNTTLGAGTLNSLTSANNNTAVGYNAGYNTLGSNNTLVGGNAGQASGDTNAWSYSTAIGWGAITTASNQIVLGRSTETVAIPGVLRALQSSDNFSSTQTMSAVPSFSILNGMVYTMATTVVGLTSLTFTDIPTTPQSTYVFTFILKPAIASTAAYLSPSTNFVGVTTAGGVVNAAVPLYGTGSVSLPATYTYLVQTITIVNTSTLATITPTLLAFVSVAGY